jgi:hypothetical protein
MEYGLLFLEVIYKLVICLDLFYEYHSIFFSHLERAGSHNPNVCKTLSGKCSRKIIDGFCFSRPG